MSLLGEHSTVGINQMVERQMRNWEMARAQLAKKKASEARVLDFIAISRSMGPRGGLVAEVLAQKLGWPVFDRQILQAMAGDDEIRARLYDSMDERDLSWWEETFRSLTQAEYRRNDYFHRLTETLLCLALKGPGIFVGRAADLILPRDKGLRVRIVAPHEMCVRNYAADHDLTLDEARHELDQAERERAQFVRRHFHVEPDDQARYDLIINEERFTTDQIVGLIAWVLLGRSAGRG